MIQVDREILAEIAPRNSGERGERQAAIIAAAAFVLPEALARYDIGTRLRIAHFLAQLCHESDGFCAAEEYASGAAYEGRADLGNTQPGDGVRYKGRGLIQLTGRANYRRIGAALGLDLETNPDLAADPRNGVLIACEFWTARHLNVLADADDVIGVTRAINGGLNGLESRKSYLARAKAALARIEGAGLVAPSPDQPVLRRGSSGEAVARLQALLRGMGYAVAIDGDFGPGTEVAVMHLQQSAGLEADGIVGARSWEKLAG